MLGSQEYQQQQHMQSENLRKHNSVAKQKRCQFKTRAQQGESIRREEVGSKVPALTSSYSPSRTSSTNLSFPFSSPQTTLPSTLETKTSENFLTPSLALVHYTPSSRPWRPLQCCLCFGSHAMRSLVPEIDRKRPIQVRKGEFQARQAERQHWSPQSRSIHTRATGTTTARIFNTAEKHPSAITRAGPTTTAAEAEKNPGTFRGDMIPGTLINVPFSNPELQQRPDTGYP